MRRRLVEAAAELVAEGGAATLTVRKVAAAAGTSTMAVYTHFGAMEPLVAAVVEEGFAMLERAFLAVDLTDDPMRDVAALTAAYLEFASDHAALYSVMFGTAPLGRFTLPLPSTDQRGRRQTLDRVAASLERGLALARLRDGRAVDLSFQWWSLVHGYALLEATGFVVAGPGRSRVLVPGLTAFFIGHGDEPERARASVEAVLGAR
ncbi:TetR/AcrR family transcriptional regulator [Nocardioides jiangxiensis]|uniref:TetR/AcrR family transcriptional regulator n=1 Tax=Nocardioides jiangxiensis TaxID=3064524 RepID=A0ABT9B2Q9_9ACTN|nr:TetR/AcrR family transcriptional regulator [Nocardioides sp. WY-20]MDO7869141.1 TetR/AcrR family transcriptional regulator [Nocardioides sp. WY-20]